MNQVFFRFYEELNDYLPEELRKVWFECLIENETSVSEKIQSLGIPLDNIDLILVNQQSRGFGYILQDGDRISVYPVFELFDLSEVSRLREKPLRNPTFICDVHLGRLCKYLRMLGWDTLYSNHYTPQGETDSKQSASMKTKTSGLFIGTSGWSYNTKKCESTD